MINHYISNGSQFTLCYFPYHNNITIKLFNHTFPTKAGILFILTSVTLPLLQTAVILMSPPGASKLKFVTGVFMVTKPVSSRAVTTQIVL